MGINIFIIFDKKIKKLKKITLKKKETNLITKIRA